MTSRLVGLKGLVQATKLRRARIETKMRHKNFRFIGIIQKGPLLSSGSVRSQRSIINQKVWLVKDQH